MLQWVSADLRTGKVIADLPSLDPQWPLRGTIGQYDTGTAKLYLDGAPVNWERAVLEGASVLHVYDDQDPALTPQWSGIVMSATRNTATDTVDLSMVTAEGYTDRRYVGDLTYSAEPQYTLIQDLVSRYIVDGAQPGLPITTLVVTPGSGTPVDHVWLDSNNATVYSRLQQIMAVQGGAEWTITWAWTTDQAKILPTLLIGSRIGSSPIAGLGPATTWSMPGCVSVAQQVRDYTSGKGANVVTAYSSGTGSITPTSGPQSAADFGGRPTYEFRWTPSTQVTDPLILTAWAQQAVKILNPGAVTLILSGAITASPRFGYDWQLGDQVGYSIGGLDDNGKDTVLAFPGGLIGTGRAISRELTDPNTITPVLAQDIIYTEPPNA